MTTKALPAEASTVRAANICDATIHMTSTKPPTDTVNSRGLFVACLIGCVIATILGTTLLASWLDATGSTLDWQALHDAAERIHAIGGQTGLDQPYARLRQGIRAMESSQFTSKP